MDVKSTVLPKGVPGVASAPQSRTDDEKKLSTDVSQAPQAASLRDAIVSELLQSSKERNHFYAGNGSTWSFTDITQTTGLVSPLNNIVQGTGWNQRLGDSVRLTRLRLRVHIRNALPSAIAPADGTDGSQEYSFAARVMVVLDKMPVIGQPTYCDAGSMGLSSGPPTSVNAVCCMPSAAFVSGTTSYPGQMVLGQRNPQTLSRYSMLREEVINVQSHYNSMAPDAGVTNTIWGRRTGSHFIDWDIPLHGMITQWYDQSNVAAQFTHKLWLIIVSDSPISTPAYHKFVSDLEFENLS